MLIDEIKHMKGVVKLITDNELLPKPVINESRLLLTQLNKIEADIIDLYEKLKEAENLISELRSDYEKD